MQSQVSSIERAAACSGIGLMPGANPLGETGYAQGSRRAHSCRLWKTYADNGPSAVFSAVETGFGTMGLRDLTHDRKPQPAAFAAVAKYSMETFEHALTLAGGNARPVVFDAQRYPRVKRSDP